MGLHSIKAVPSTRFARSGPAPSSRFAPSAEATSTVFGRSGQGEQAGVAELATADDFASLVRKHQGMVFSLALHFLRDRQAAEEIAQDVFLKLHENLDTLQSPEHVTHWLRKVTSHRCIDYSRRRKWPQVHLDDLPELRVDETHGDPLLASKLRELVAALPGPARMVMVLRYQEDLTPSEIAGVLAMPVATVKSHLQRSLARLREKVTGIFGDLRI